MARDGVPLVTVYITSHNYGQFLEQAIESVLRQTLRDFELIIIDDGSTDNSREIIARYETHERVIPIFQQNKGLNVTNNIALRAARGKYVVRLDADDWFDEHMLEILSGVLERYPEVGLVFPDYYKVDRNGKILEQVRRHDFDDVTLQDQPAHGACTMIRRRCLEEIGGYNEAFTCQDGFDLWIRFIEKYEIRNVNLPLFYYRQHENSLTANEGRLLSTRSEILRNYAQSKGRAITAVAIVAVRGPEIDAGSTVLSTLKGKPLIDWTLEEALRAERLSRVIVTTPDQSVLDHVRRTFGNRVDTIHRDLHMAMPNTDLHPTLIDALDRHRERFGSEPDATIVLAIEYPFRSAHFIDAAIDTMELFSTDSVISVQLDNEAFFRHDGSGLRPIQSSALRLEREELYRQTGGIWLAKTNVMRRERSIVCGRVGHVILDSRSGWRLRDRLSWSVAEHLASVAENSKEVAA